MILSNAEKLPSLAISRWIEINAQLMYTLLFTGGANRGFGEQTREEFSGRVQLLYC